MNKKFFMTTIQKPSQDFDITYDLSNSITIISNTSNLYDAWQRVDIVPAAGSRGNCNININVESQLTTIGTGTTAETFWGVSSGPTTAPSTWTTLQIAVSGQAFTSTNNIVIAAGEYLFLRIYASKAPLAGREAHTRVTLENGTGAPYVCGDGNTINSLIASGSPLTWYHSVGAV